MCVHIMNFLKAMKTSFDVAVDRYLAINPILKVKINSGGGNERVGKQIL